MHPIFTRGPDAPAALGGWITLDSPSAMDAMAGAGFDYLCIDTQHSLIGITEACHLLHVVRDGLPLLVRAPGHDAADIGKLLDCGADGVVVPMIETAAQAQAVSKACAYPPHGTRSFGPIRRDLPRTPAALAVRAGCFAMIETREGAANVMEIAAVPGIIGLYLGPADLAIGLGLDPGAWHAPAVQQAARDMIAACRAAGKIAAGHATSAAQASDMIALAYDCVSLTSDKALIAAAATALLGELRPLSGW